MKWWLVCWASNGKIPAKKTKVSDERVFSNKLLLKWLCSKSLCLHFCPAALSWEEHLLQDAKSLVFFKAREVWFCGTCRLWEIVIHFFQIQILFDFSCVHSSSKLPLVSKGKLTFGSLASVPGTTLMLPNTNVDIQRMLTSCFSWQEFFSQYSNWKL